MALDRAARFNAKGLDPRLLEILEVAGERFPLRVEAFSGVAGRTSGTRNHPTGRAVDLTIYGRDGKPLPNVRDAGSFRTYEQFAQVAREVQQQLYPELNDKFRWGGYFRQGTSFDLMHFDVSGGGTAYGNWDTGLNEAGRDALERISGRAPRSVGMRSPGYQSPADMTAMAYQEPDRPSSPGVDAVNFMAESMPADAAPAPGMPTPRPRPLDNTIMLRRGSKGAEVADLQSFLVGQGASLGKIDGKFGPRTMAAVRAFQKLSGAKVDGIVGPETRRFITEARHPPVPRQRPRMGSPFIPPQSGVGMPSIAPPLPPQNGVGMAPIAPTPPPLPPISGVGMPSIAPAPRPRPDMPALAPGKQPGWAAAIQDAISSAGVQPAPSPMPSAPPPMPRPASIATQSAPPVFPPGGPGAPSIAPARHPGGKPWWAAAIQDAAGGGSAAPPPPTLGTGGGGIIEKLKSALMPNMGGQPAAAGPPPGIMSGISGGNGQPFRSFLSSFFKML